MTSEVQCSSACGGEPGGGGHLALADRPAFHTDTNATWDTHYSSHCGEKRERVSSQTRKRLGPHALT